MEHVRYPFPHSSSICWFDNSLIDWVSGGCTVDLNGNITDASVRYAYKFDSAIQSSCGRYAVIFENLGTKGLVLADGNVVREINRSFYQADVYAYPVAIFTNEKQVPLLAHCPDAYNELRIERLLDGKDLFPDSPKSKIDFFHSRLRTSPNGRSILSAGWLWHPFDFVSVHELNNVSLNVALELPEIDAEVCGADFVTDELIVICTSSDTLNDEPISDSVVGSNTIAVIDKRTMKIKSQTKSEAQLGNCRALSESELLSFHQHPMLISIQSGKVLEQWRDINCGNGQSSIIGNSKSIISSIAVDVRNRRFAVCSGQEVDIVLNL